jgi:hypothetical protein
VSPDSESPPSLPPGLTRCLVVGRIEDLPKAWLERVRAGRGAVEAVAHPLIAFAEALRHEVADRLRPSFGLSRQESIAVVFTEAVSGGNAAELEAFAAAIRAHAPEVGVWTVVDGSPRRLGGEPRPGPDPAKPPSLRLAGTDAAPPVPPAAPVAPTPPLAPPEAEVAPSVTPEEIEMLLRFFDADPDAAPGEASDPPKGGGR